MDEFACNLIGTLGGTTAVSRLSDCPTSTVQSWKSNGIPASRLSHLKLIAKAEGVSVDWTTGLPLGDGDGSAADHVDVDSCDAAKASHGKAEELSTQGAGAC